MRPGVADEVEPRPAEPLPTQIADCLGRRKIGRAGRVVSSTAERSISGYDGGQREPTNGLRGRLKRRRPSEPDPGNAGAGRLERLGPTNGVRRSAPIERDDQTETTEYDAIFVGGGVIGLACAWRAARARRARLRARARAAGRGRDRGRRRACSRRWARRPGARRRCSRSTSSRCGAGRTSPSELRGRLRASRSATARCGALHVALDRDEAEELRRRHELHGASGLDSEWLRGRECRQLEPGLATAVRGGVARPRRGERRSAGAVVAALLAALERGGREPFTRGGGRFGRSGRAPPGGCETADGRSFTRRSVVLAAGCWSGRIDWIPPEARPPVRPVKGEILTLRGTGERAGLRADRGRRAGLHGAPRRTGG